MKTTFNSTNKLTLSYVFFLFFETFTERSNKLSKLFE